MSVTGGSGTVSLPVDVQDLDMVRAQTAGLWSQMRGQRIFITGGTGFFGCWLLESFAYINRVEQLDAQATVLTRNPAAFTAKCPHLAADPAITRVDGDVRSFAFPDGDYAYVIHAATESSAKNGKAATPLETLATILDGTERTLEFAATHGTQKFLLTSSGAVYGRQPREITPIPEDYTGGLDALDASSAYAEGKRVSEQMCSLYAAKTGMECKVARCFAFVGPHLPLDAHFAIGNFIRDAMRGGPIQISGDGSPLRSYLYAADLVAWLWTILFSAPSLQVFNVGSEHAISIRDLAHAVVAALDVDVEVMVAKQPDPDTPLLQYVPSTQRAEQELNLKPLVDLHESIRRTAAWHGFPVRT